MPLDLKKTYIYHITDVSNLPAILAAGGLQSDAVIRQSGGPTTGIGYDHIKERRLNEYRVPCAGNRFVGEFVPFYYCPRSPMLFTVNIGKTGRPKGCQSNIIHMVSSVQIAIDLGWPWALSDGNAGAGYAQTYANEAMLDNLDWGAIEARDWRGKTHAKMAEFLVADFFPWTCFMAIGCHNVQVVEQVVKLLANSAHKPKILTTPTWYY